MCCFCLWNIKCVLHICRAYAWQRHSDNQGWSGWTHCWGPGDMQRGSKHQFQLLTLTQNSIHLQWWEGRTHWTKRQVYVIMFSMISSGRHTYMSWQHIFFFLLFFSTSDTCLSAKFLSDFLWCSLPVFISCFFFLKTEWFMLLIRPFNLQLKTIPITLLIFERCSDDFVGNPVFPLPLMNMGTCSHS